MLEKHGLSFPHTGLTTKFRSIDFNSKVDVVMPGGGVDRRPFKPYHVNILRKWFEDGIIEICGTDDLFENELTQFGVLSRTMATIKYTTENDHVIAAVLLAVAGMQDKVYNPMTPKIATQVHQLPLSTLYDRGYSAKRPGASMQYSRTASPMTPSRGLTRHNMGPNIRGPSRIQRRGSMR